MSADEQIGQKALPLPIWDSLPTWAQWILALPLLVISMASFYLIIGFGFGLMEFMGELPGRIVQAIKDFYKHNKETPK